MAERFTPTKADLEALQRAVEMTLTDPDRDRVKQVEDMLKERDWYDVATFCSYHQQVNNLRLKPWESPPCWIGGDAIIDPEIMELGNRLERAGLSLYEPDPLKALENAR